MTSRIAVISFILLSFYSCSKSSVEYSDEFKLAKQEEIWESKGINSYSFTQRISCFCSEEYTLPKEVIVFENQIISVNGIPYDPSTDSSILRIEDRFDFITNGLERNPEIYRVTYDLEYGFVSDFYFDFSLNIADEEIQYYFTDFSPN
jgi:hypothetical protein